MVKDSPLYEGPWEFKLGEFALSFGLNPYIDPRPKTWLDLTKRGLRPLPGPVYPTVVFPGSGRVLEV